MEMEIGYWVVSNEKKFFPLPISSTLPSAMKMFEKLVNGSISYRVVFVLQPLGFENSHAYL